jgi:crotonobetainyl-CoA:carnitine CoA-transferase CaiB-like acyl-CoA transferase
MNPRWLPLGGLEVLDFGHTVMGPASGMIFQPEQAQHRRGSEVRGGPSGRPLRAGTSVVDIARGVLAVIANLIALGERSRTGRGQRIGTFRNSRLPNGSAPLRRLSILRAPSADA